MQTRGEVPWQSVVCGVFCSKIGLSGREGGSKAECCMWRVLQIGNEVVVRL
jgi:hypothetical protein